MANGTIHSQEFRQGLVGIFIIIRCCTTIKKCIVDSSINPHCIVSYGFIQKKMKEGGVILQRATDSDDSVMQLCVRNNTRLCVRRVKFQL